MLEIIALFYFSKKIGHLANKKGLAPGKWKFLFIVGWFLLEIIGFVVGVWIFGKDDLVPIILLAYMFAITSYTVLKAYLSKLSDAVWEDDINEIGNN